MGRRWSPLYARSMTRDAFGSKHGALLALLALFATLVACGASPSRETASTGSASTRSVPDVDEDGVPDEHDACTDPSEPRTFEDRDGFDDDDGCAEPNNDGDAVLDVDDLCPNDAEDVDGFEDADGCPDLDNDGDRNPDACDACPNEAELYNGECDEDGCPDCGRVLLIETRLMIVDRCYFARRSDALDERSLAVLGAVADTLEGNPQIVAVRVLGSIARGEPAALALARAEAVVDALVARGIARDRLHAEAAAPEGSSPRAVRFEIRCADSETCEGPPVGASAPCVACRPVAGCPVP